MPLIYFWPCWVLVAAGRLSLVVMIWGCSLVVMRGHVFAVPSLVRARRPNHPEACGVFPQRGPHPRLLCWQVGPSLLGHQGSPVFNLLRNCQSVFPKWSHHFTFSPTAYEGSSSSESPSTLVNSLSFLLLPP